MTVKILPFFFPNSGCPSRCAYCDQSRTMGNALAMPAAGDVRRHAARARAELQAAGATSRLEAAFFGGTFTAFPRKVQDEYLHAAAKLKEEGVIDAVRVSTHPAYIDRAAAGRLADHGVDTVELGIQSFADRALVQCGRGYDGARARAACEEVKAAGLDLVVQLMPFLPGAGEEDDLRSAEETAELRPAGVRIFPTVVITGTRLHAWWLAGDYRAAEVTEAVDRVAEMLGILLPAGVPVIRIGLQVSEVTDGAVAAGPYHPALGELCYSALLAGVVARYGTREGKEDVDVVVDSSLASLLTGHGRAGEARLRRLLPGRRVTVAANNVSVPDQSAQTLWSCDRFVLMQYNGRALVVRRASHGA